MKASSKKRKTAVKKVAKVAKKRAKPAAPRKLARPTKPTKPVKTKPGTTRAGAEASPPRFFWMFAFYSREGTAPVGWEAAWGGTPRIPVPPIEGEEPVDPGTPDLVPVGLGGMSPKQLDHVLFFISSPVFSSQEDAVGYARGDHQGSYFFENCTNCVLYQVD